MTNSDRTSRVYDGVVAAYVRDIAIRTHSSPSHRLSPKREGAGDGEDQRLVDG
jgi:hypothetical protein